MSHTIPFHKLNPVTMTVKKPWCTGAPEFVIHSGISKLDHFLGGFKAGELTLLDGNSSLITHLPYRLCITTYQAFHSDTIYIDGGMAANPYLIAQYARQFELNQHHVLSHVHISRAFTVYQLATLIHDSVESLIQQHQPRTLLIGMFPALYLDPDVSSHEAQTLLKENLMQLVRLARRYQLITVLTHRDRTMIPTQRNLRKLVYTPMYEIVRLRTIDHGVYIDLVKKHRAITLRHTTNEQRNLEDFMSTRYQYNYALRSENRAL